MNSLLKISRDRSVQFLFFIVLVLIVTSAVGFGKLTLEYTFLIVTPLFLLYCLRKQNSLSVSFVSFLIFSLGGHAFMVFVQGESGTKIAHVLYMLAYLYLIVMVLPKFKLKNFDRLIMAYLLAVFCISLYFLYSVFSLLKVVIADDLESLLFAIKSLGIVLLSFVALGIYLSTETKQSIYLLLAVMCFGFSAVINYIEMYYLYDFNFLIVERILYVSGLFLVFKYVYLEDTYHKLIVTKTYTSKNILAKL
ncbi:hypothetical protein [Gaetbulibacter saemankumensis]|uniref:hypothetical protein n=1 Tax=Gaetbulibacter saemankumensis TaxID=311208 RepID=UPI0004143827|nr:hypothetical protein [Gaetbulibacter saemankumensis]